ncbi:MAG: hypothetical protein EA397_06335 [Deltaproteobacteria bacterium]|nr:MAG: hypothetical protein EA397_06335 [Deltaproteobacteria bacterium]
MLNRITLPALALATIASGCIVYESDYRDQPVRRAPPAVVNYAPEILDADAGCYFDRTYRDDIWVFDAIVDDPNGPEDVIAVWADVYDEWDGSLVESFELFPTQHDPYHWFSDWLGSTTWLICGYDLYTVDIVAYDQLDAIDVLTIMPWWD